jgi:NADP-dependent 3-hydroxy acid dehydrogenase YdfG
MRTILITGASSGIGRAVARRLLAKGHRVIGTTRNLQNFSTTHSNFVGVRLDLGKPQSISPFARNVLKEHPALSAVVFAAGYGQFGSLEEFSAQQIEQLMMVNFTAQALLTRALLPTLKCQTDVKLIYIGSEAALQGSRKGSIYCASKFALRGFSQALRDECGKTSVKVSLINPGMVKTAFFDTLAFMPGSESGQFLMAEDVADAVCYVIEAGSHLVIDEINLNPVNKVIRFKQKSGK